MRGRSASLVAGLVLLMSCGGGGNSPSGSGGAGGSGGSHASGRTGGSGGSSATAGSGGSSAGSSGSAGTGGSAAAGSGGSGSPGDDAAAGTGGAPDDDAHAPDDDAPVGGDDGGPSSDASVDDGDGGLPPPPPGMTSIFDGKTMTGWECKADIWSIRDGALYAKTGGPGEDLCRSKTDYGTFRLVFNERAVATTNHMGVGFWGDHTAKYGKALVVIPPSGHMWDYNSNKDVPNTGVGSANNDIKFKWHQVEVLANKMTGDVLVAVNGKVTTTYKDPNLAGRKVGPVGFQAHAGASEEEYKDVFVEADPKELKLLTLKP